MEANCNELWSLVGEIELTCKDMVVMLILLKGMENDKSASLKGGRNRPALGMEDIRATERTAVTKKLDKSTEATGGAADVELPPHIASMHWMAFLPSSVRLPQWMGRHGHGHGKIPKATSMSPTPLLDSTDNIQGGTSAG